MQACFSLLKPSLQRAEASSKLPAILVVGTGAIVLWGMLWLNGYLFEQSALSRAESQQRLRQVRGLVRFHIKSPKKRLKRFTQYLDQEQIAHQLQGKKRGRIQAEPHCFRKRPGIRIGTVETKPPSIGLSPFDSWKGAAPSWPIIGV